MQPITRVYDTYNNARKAVSELETVGVPMADISVLANQEVTRDYDDDNSRDTEVGPGAGLGAVVGGAAGLLTGLGLMAIPGLGPVVAAGWLATTALGVVAGGATGGIVGSLIDAGVPEDHANIYSEAVRRGGTLVSVQTQDHNRVKVHSILDRFSPLDPVEQGVAYRNDGWNKFDPNGGAYGFVKNPVEHDHRTM